MTMWCSRYYMKIVTLTTKKPQFLSLSLLHAVVLLQGRHQGIALSSSKIEN